MAYNPKLFIFTGPSGVGKGTVLKEFFKRTENIVYSISSTTRAPREGEVNGIHYNFIKKEEFLDLIKKDSFLEWAKYSENYYGTSKTFVENALNQGKSVLLEIELQGALQVMEKIKDKVTVFIRPPSFEELEKRLRGRKSEDEATILKRLETAKNELKNQDKFKYVIINDKVEDAVNELIKIYKKETGI